MARVSLRSIGVLYPRNLDSHLPYTVRDAPFLHESARAAAGCPELAMESSRPTAGHHDPVTGPAGHIHILPGWQIDMNRVRNVALAATLILVPACGTGFRAGPIGLVKTPTGDFADTRSTGFTVGVAGEARFLLSSITGEVGWSKFMAEDSNGESNADTDFWEFAAGGRYFTGPLFIGTQIGYLTNQDFSGDEILRPEVGLRLGQLDLLARYKLGGDAQWWSVGLSYSVR